MAAITPRRAIKVADVSMSAPKSNSGVSTVPLVAGAPRWLAKKQALAVYVGEDEASSETCGSSVRQ